MKSKDIIILLILVIYKLIYKTSFVINILIIIFIYYLMYKLIESKLLKKVLQICFGLGITVFIVSLGTLLNDIYTNQKKGLKNDYVIILGAGLDKDKPKKVLINRLDKGVEYYTLYPETIFIVSGGMGKDETVTESYAMKKYLKEKGVPTDQIIEEDKSTSTLENLMFSRNKVPLDNSIGVITNSFHVYRAKYFGEKIGLKLNGVYAKTPFLGLASNYLRESVAIIYYHLKDKIELIK